MVSFPRELYTIQIDCTHNIVTKSVIHAFDLFQNVVLISVLG